MTKRGKRAKLSRECLSKQRYPTKKSAEFAARLLKKKAPYFKFNVYTCNNCKSFHVGRPQRLIQIIDNIHNLTR